MCKKINLKQRSIIVFLLLFTAATVIFIMFRSAISRSTYFTAGAWVQSFFKITDQKYFDLLEDYGSYDELAEVVDSENPDELWDALEMEDVVHDNHIHAVVLMSQQEDIVARAGKINPYMLKADKGIISSKIEYYNHFKYFKYFNDSLFIVYGVPVKNAEKKRIDSGGYLLAIGYIQDIAAQTLPPDLWSVEYVKHKDNLLQGLNPVLVNEFITDINNVDYGVLQFSFSGSDAIIGSRFWIWYIAIASLLLLGCIFINCAVNEKELKDEIDKVSKLKVFLEAMPARVYVKDSNLKFDFVNNLFASSFGLKPEDFIGKDERQMGLPDELTPIFDEDRIVFANNKSRMLKMHFLKFQDDVQKCYSVSKIPLEYSGKRGIYCAMMDISKGREHEKNIIEQNRMLQSTIDNLTDLYLRTDLNGVIIQASRSCCEALGYDKLDDIIGHNITEVASSSVDWEAIARTGYVKEFSFKIKNHKGKTIHCEANINTFYDNDGAPAGYEGIVRNITEHKQYEQQLKALTENLMASLEQTEEKKNQLENVHRRMEESLTYAKRIQDALFYPSSEKTTKVFPDSFVMYQPCEIVGGDFYFVTNINETKVCVVADCTGHGVPGALMSVLSASILQNILNTHFGEEGFSPATMLEQLRQKIIEALQNSVILRDGLDIALVFINGTKMQYSGANIPLVVVRDGELSLYAPTKCPIGIHPMQLKFTNEEIELQKDDMVYIASDGYPDQFGISENRKYSRRDFNALLAQIATLPCQQQKQRLEEELIIWRGTRKQTDDITIFGFRA